ncbi:MAG: hypothetical protein JSR60_19475 [Proteobacteria bacterium]|nr:hypothetical protein [Pseudomonadota bacterium]
MAPLADYLMPRDAEIALARSAAPAAISADASVMVLTPKGYETAVTGTNGYVCLVERGWEAGFDDPDFWNTKLRGPICFNPPAVETVVPAHLERTDWVLAGLGAAEMRERARASALANATPAIGAMCFMMSKDGYLSDTGKHWHPHLMFYLPAADAASWGANLTGSPVFGGAGDPEPVVTYMVVVPKWSDGSSAMEMPAP